jgi:hypothetical protein
MAKKQQDEAVVIDFRQYRNSLATFIGDSIREFSKKHPETEVALIGILGDVYRGSFDLYFGTQLASDEFVEEYGSRNAPDAIHFIGTDKFGQFCINCENFREPGWYAQLELLDYPFIQDIKRTISIDFIDFQGKLTRIDGNEDGRGSAGFWPPVFAYMKAECEALELPNALNHSDVLRVGIQIYEAGLNEFWAVVPKSKRATATKKKAKTKNAGAKKPIRKKVVKKKKK